MKKICIIAICTMLLTVSACTKRTSSNTYITNKERYLDSVANAAKEDTLMP